MLCGRESKRRRDRPQDCGPFGSNPLIDIYKMATKSTIEWTEMTWNPVTGCTKISQGCKHCYAERMAKRLTAMGSERYRNGFNITLHPDLVDMPRGWRQPRVVFVNSMSDLFHDEIPLAYIQRVFATMRDCPHHTFQVLTKRAERLSELAPHPPLALERLDGRQRRRCPRVE